MKALEKVKDQKDVGAMTQAVQHMSIPQLLKLRLSNRMMKQLADGEIVHRHNVKFGKNETPIGKRIYDLNMPYLSSWQGSQKRENQATAQFHSGISKLAGMILPYFNDDDTPYDFGNNNNDEVEEEEEEEQDKLRPELYDELNIALNHYLHVMASEIKGNGTVETAIKRMFKPGSKKALQLLAGIEKYYRRTLTELSQGDTMISIDDIPYESHWEIYGTSYPSSPFRYSEIDPKEVKRVLNPHYNFSDQYYIHIAVALTHLASELMATGQDRGKFRTRNHVKEAAVVLFDKEQMDLFHLYM